MISTARVVVWLLLGIGVTGGCSAAPGTRESKSELVQQANAALKEWNDHVPGLDRFKQGRFDFSTDTSTVLPKLGCATGVPLVEGITVFSEPIAGVMTATTMGGQWFTFVPEKAAP